MTTNQDTPELNRMGAWLGYTYLLREDRTECIPLTTFVLPVHPFTIIRPFVIVTELILDDHGNSIVTNRNRLRTKHTIRWIRFRSFR